VGFLLAVALGARAASAAEADFTLKCPELSAEDVAQVEARVRADLLSAGLTPAAVDLSCDVAAAQAQVTGNGQQVTLRTDRNASSVKEALLASAENALSAWAAQIASPGTAPAASSSLPLGAALEAPAPEPAPAPVPAPPPAPAATPIAPPGRPPDARPTVRSSSASTWISAGPRAELWHSGWALGGQLGLQRKWTSTFAAIRAAYLFGLPVSSEFSAYELQLGAEFGFQPAGALGLRGALGLGLSFFGVSPATGVSALDGSSSTLPCVSFEISRPVALGPLALLPAVGARAFARSRGVRVDGQEVLALPALSLAASLSLALKVGG